MINLAVPTLPTTMPVKSVFDWIIIFKILGFSFDWNLAWADYKGGIGSIDADHLWLGLEKMHLLTSSQPYRLRVEAQSASSNLWYSAEYWYFKIGDELNDKYRLEVAGYSGDAGDSLQYEGDLAGDVRFGGYKHSGMSFTTYDQDNDKHFLPNYNCAPARGGGWWYNACYWACLTCQQGKREWGTLPGGIRAKGGRMMIKPQ